MELVRLKVVLAFNQYRVGDVIERMPSVAKTMLAKRWYGQKMVEPIGEPVPTAKIETEPRVVTPVASPIIQPQSESFHDSRAELESRQSDHPAKRRNQRNRDGNG